MPMGQHQSAQHGSPPDETCEDDRSGQRNEKDAETDESEVFEDVLTEGDWLGHLRVCIAQRGVYGRDGSKRTKRRGVSSFPGEGRGAGDALLGGKPKTITTTTTTFVVYFDLVTPSIVLKVTQNGNYTRGNLGIRGFFQQRN